MPIRQSFLYKIKMDLPPDFTLKVSGNGDGIIYHGNNKIGYVWVSQNYIETEMLVFAELMSDKGYTVEMVVL